MSITVIVFLLVYVSLAIAMCWQESRTRNIHFGTALLITFGLAIILPIIGALFAYFIILSIKKKDGSEKDSELLDDF